MSKNEALYKKIVDYIESNIREGIYVVGTIIPSESELAKLFGVSRMTARRATSELVDLGVLFRIKGKGTVVANNKVERTNYFDGFTGSKEAEEQGVTAKILSLTIVQATKDLAQKLNIIEGDDVYVIKRIRLKYNIPYVFETIRISKRRFPDFEKNDISKVSFYQVLKNEYNTELEFVDIDITIINMHDTEVVNVLYPQNKEGMVVCINESSYDTKGLVVEYSTSFYNPIYFSTNYRITRNFGFIKTSS